jgi:putative ABC transport system permease protein
MLPNYIKIATRNLWRYKGYSFINILGLAVGMACCTLILLFVLDELSYDKFNENSDRIYRVTREWFNSDGTPSLHLARVAPPIGTLLKQDFPDMIEKMVRIRSDYNTLLKVDDRTFIENHFRWAGNSFFDIFSFKLLHGDPKTALVEPNTVVLTNSTAKRYFGSADAAMGKIINYENERDLLVTGVVEDVPHNSHFKFDFLGSFQTLYDMFGAEYMTRNWGRNNYATYLLLAKNVPAATLRSQFPAFLDKYLTQVSLENDGREPSITPSRVNQLHLQRLTDIHLKSHLNSEWEPNGDIKNVYLFTLIALFILLIACINFMNLSTARSSNRAHEIGMRKVLGAQRTQLIIQFLGESVFVALVAFVIALGMVELAFPAFNNFSGKELTMNLTENFSLLLGLAGLLLFVGLLSGSYPALYLSGFRPIKVLKNVSKNGLSRSRFRTVLVVLQFSISIGLIICVGGMYSQLQFWHNTDLGYDKEHIVLLPSDQSIMEKIESVKSRMLQNPNIISVATSRLVPTNNLLNSWGGETLEDGKEEPIQFRLAAQEVDYDFIDTYKMKLVAGRNFSRKYATDDTAAFILNESAVRKLGWGPPDNAIGKPLQYGGQDGHVIGVLKDFFFESLRNEIVPIIFLITKNSNYTVSVRIRPENTKATLQFLENLWTELRPNYPFEYRFLDEQYDNLYKSEERLMEIFGVFSILAIFVACLGLLGLASFTAEQKTKEIGIRKVLGASVGRIVFLLTKEYTRWVLIANLIAWPVAWWGMNRWLENFAYRIHIGWQIFILSATIALFIALFTVSWQAIRAALANPVESLRYE